MKRPIGLLPLVFLLTIWSVAALGQAVPPTAAPAGGPLLKSNPKISRPDFDAAKTEMLAAGGEKAELVYAARIDAVTRGAFDSLIVIYDKPAKTGAESFAFILREAQRHPLVFDKQDKAARALKPGDKFLQIGLRHEEGKSPLIRLMTETVDKEKVRQRRNLDFQFNGTEFAQVGQSLMPLPK